jgi:hypothetical protein
VIFLAELNQLEFWVAEVGNVYLETLTKAKVYISGGPEFGDLDGHTLLIFMALYGLQSSSLFWHQRKAKSDIWMRENNGLYEYRAVYADDLLIERTLEESHKFKLKGVGSLTHHLGYDYFCDKDGTLCYGPRKYYITKIMDQYENMFGCKPKEYTSPLEKGDQMKRDDTDELDMRESKGIIQ